VAGVAGWDTNGTPGTPGNAHVALGYESWGDYATTEFGPRTAGLTASIRRELVATLSAEVDGSPALSTRQIAPAVGVTQQMVVKDRQVTTPVVTSPATPPFYTPAGEVLDGATLVTDSGVIVAEQRHVDAPASVLGLDGKTYTRTVRCSVLNTWTPSPSPRRTR
jgi:hypothetical protein